MFVLMLTLGFALLALPNAVPSGGTRNPGLQLPTASIPTSTPGPPVPARIEFVAEEPITGLPNCNIYGVEGMIQTDKGQGLSNTQVVIWDEATGLLDLGVTDSTGRYRIDLEGDLALHKLWVQVFNNDQPVSQPILVEPQIDCQQGFQIFLVNWRRTVQ